MKIDARTRILPVISLALAVFAGLKITNVWIGFSASEAQTAVSPAGADGEAVQEAPPPQISPGEVERRILENLAKRRASLEEREDELAVREAVVAAAELRLDDKISTFEVERAALVALREQRNADDSEEIASIVSAYERMKPKDAAVIFNALDEKILVPLAAGMRTQALAGVLAEMEPDNARRLTTLLAERNKAGEETTSAAGEIQ